MCCKIVVQSLMIEFYKEVHCIDFVSQETHRADVSRHSPVR